MMGTFECIYETPCHWCTKWDKKCNRKIGKDNFTGEDKKLFNYLTTIELEKKG
ncbi:MAG: hypothetical protein ACI4DK_07240 [Lachnospiraceae bacterium]